MKRTFYTSPKASKLKLFFWKAAGGDKELLERSTYSDQIKYMCLGGIIVATGVMAGIAGGYAFYTIFQQRGPATDGIVTADEMQWGVVALSFVFGTLWGLMIFNLDRFIVSSTGVGDGTEAITWSELKGAIPRLILGAIIAITISKPVEIRMFKSEIDVELRKAQIQKQIEFKEEIEKQYNPLIKADSIKLANLKNEENIFTAELNAELNALKENTQIYEDAVKAAEDKRDEFLKISPWSRRTLSRYQERVDAAKRERDDWYEKIKQKEDEIELKKAEFKEENKTTWDKYENSMTNNELAKQSALNENEVAAFGLDGLLERIKLAHEIAGFWISLFITLLFMAIELTPIFFKLMLIKSPYDFMKHNVEELLIAEQGIQIHRNYHMDKQGKELDWIQHHYSERLHIELMKVTNEKKSLLQAQEELTDYAISKYKEDMMKKIDADPQAYIKTDETTTDADNEA